MTTTISNLPMDLVEDILTRIPSKSMRAVRLTCKVWNALFKSRSFTKMHIGKEEAAKESEEFRMIVLRDYNAYLTSVVVNENPSTERQGKLTFLKDSEQVKISQVFHCEGLLLCILKYPDTRLVVWNPYLGQTRWIETIYTYRGPDGLDLYKYAFGYETRNGKSCRTHKILRFMQYYTDGIKENFLYEIYNFDSGLWTKLDVPRDWFIGKHVSVKGNTYWWVEAEENNSDVDQIICFDFTREKFEPFMHSPSDDKKFYIVYLSSVGDEKLAVLLETIWITIKIDAKNVSWSKFMTLDTTPDIISYRGFLVDEEKKVAMFFLRNTVCIFGEGAYFRELDLRVPSHKRHWPYPYVCSYVPSLVEIKQHEGRKQKKLSNFEMRLYDRNMSRLLGLEEA